MAPGAQFTGSAGLRLLIGAQFTGSAGLRL